MLQAYALVGLFLVVTVVLLGATLLLWWLLRPKKPNPLKLETYECGVQTVGDAWVQFRAQYYIFALIFVLFDVEAVFLFPWAVAYNRLGVLCRGRDGPLFAPSVGRSAVCLAEGVVGVGLRP